MESLRCEPNPAEQSNEAEQAIPSCAHCRLPVPAGLVRQGDELQFCCMGCRTVYAALRDHELLAYYDERARYSGNERSGPGRATDDDYLHFDEPEFLERHTTLHQDNHVRSFEAYLDGLHCPACIWVVERIPSLLEGVVDARANFSDGRLRVVYDPGHVRLSAIAKTLDSLGYPPHPASQGRSRSLQRQLDRALLVRIGVAAATFGNVMLLSFALYSGEAQGMGETTAEFFRWVSFAIAVPSVLWTSQTFFRGAWAALRTRRAHMDIPISIGISAALCWGTFATLTGSGEIYFDTVTMLVFLLLIGRWLQTKQQRVASDATDLLFALAPSTSRWLEGDRVREVPTDSIPRGALVELRSGDRIGIDGVVVEGSSSIDESLLTGESRPTRVGPGADVHAGTVNVSSRLVVRAVETGRQTRLAQLVKQVEEAASRKAPIVLLADRLSGVFVVVVMGLALLTLWVWGVAAGLPHAIALLIVTCPCALGLATPLAASVALGRAAKRGVLIKGMQYLELLSRPGLIVFDKTGTLTAGQLRLVEFDGTAHAAALVRAVERQSAHPVARALTRDLPLGEALLVSGFVEHPGSGVSGRVGGHLVRVGTSQYLESAGVHVDQDRVQALLSKGLSPICIAVDGRHAATAGLGDPIREEAKSILNRLREQGYQLAILSGDHQTVVDRVARAMGVEFECALGGQPPEAKLAFVEHAREQGIVYMVGDGVNDAAALAAAHVGIAVQGGAEASLAAADVFTTAGGLAPVGLLTRGARKAMGVIHRNLAFSLAYNITAATLAVAGLISPLIAAVLMPLSSLTVLTNSLRSRTFEDLR